ncbi:MAG: LytTR family DNA-binding domain-containing protein [Bacteroidota bacterium]|nr:LytTR family DNA-binding domain-containing protein [Candidatus Kapabacteria bacterium]MDW8220031.1 LytTR family DNA-binding domain-containing protein [Bacteroidota bacterium]
MNMLRVIIADDEMPARMLLREYLSSMPQVLLVGEAENGYEAVKLINATQPDAIILDIQMPELTGFEVLEQVQNIPHVIFSTAFSEFAVQAFEENAVDYLLKPYSKERLHRAMLRLYERYHTSEASNYHPSIESLARLLTITPLHQQSPASSEDTQLSRIMVRSGNRIIPLSPEDIIWIEAAQDYALLHTVKGKFTSAVGIGLLEKRLNKRIFMRVHRSAIVNLQHIHHGETDTHGNLTIHMTNGTKVRVSRSYSSSVRSLIM